MESKSQRKIVLISRAFQFRQIASFALLNTLIMLLFAGCLYLFLNSEIEANLFSAHASYRNLKQMLFPIVLTLSLLNILISSLVIALFELYASHKIAGPLYRFNAALEEVSNRNLKPVTSVRQDDQLREISASLRKVTDTFQQDFIEMKSKLAVIRSLKKEEPSSKELAGIIEELDAMLGRYRY